MALAVVRCGRRSVIEISYVRKVEERTDCAAAMQVEDGMRRGGIESEGWLVVLEVDGRLGHEGEFVATDRTRDRRAAGTRG